MIQVGSHEPLSFRRRTGHARANEADLWMREHSEEVVERLARRGVTWVRTHFFKGNGLKVEAPEIEMTRRFVRLCHDHGIKVQLYTQFGTMQYETLLAEAPDMENWSCVNEEGQLVRIRYGHQDFRLKPCTVRDGWWTYLRKVLTVGIRTVEGDGFGLDNVESPMEPDACHCPECRAAFVAFLKARYPTRTRRDRERAVERFGFDVLDHVRPPVFNRFNPPVAYRRIANPVMQEWIAFRCENLRRRFEEIHRHVKRLKPEMMIEYNVYPPAGKNGPYWQGIDMHRLGPYLDMFYNERDPSPPEFRPDGVFWHRVHGYKLGEAIGAEGVITGNGGRNVEQQRLALSEVLAFNRGHIVRIGRTDMIADGGFPEADAFIAFRRAHPELFADTRSAAEVGLVESAASRAFNSVDPYLAEILAMNGLLAGHVPFDLVTDIESCAESRRAVLVLPETQCVSDDEAAALTAYVKSGGGLVMTGSSCLFDGWARRRPNSALAAMLGGAKGDAPPASALRGSFGKGRFVWLPGLTSPTGFEDFEHCTDGPNIRPDNWHVPANQRAFLNGIRWAGRRRLTLAVRGTAGLAVEARRTGDGRLILHLVNYRLNRAARDVAAVVSGTVASARLFTPWRKRPKALRCAKSGKAIRITVGTVARYAVIEIT